MNRGRVDPNPEVLNSCGRNRDANADLVEKLEAGVAPRDEPAPAPTTDSHEVPEASEEPLLLWGIRDDRDGRRRRFRGPSRNEVP
jgi:hypothetical protein